MQGFLSEERRGAVLRNLRTDAGTMTRDYLSAAREVLQEQGLARLAGQVATLEHGTDGAFAGLVDGLGHGAELAVFTYREDQGGGFYGCSSYAFYNQFHVRIPE